MATTSPTIAWLKVTATQAATNRAHAADIFLRFKTQRGVAVTAVLPFEDAKVIKRDRKRKTALVPVTVLAAFSKMTHIRLPCGMHAHVANELLSGAR